MTSHQVQLIDAEISRHISLALIAKEPEIKNGHMEVAQALTAALVLVDKRRLENCRNFVLVSPTALSLPRLKVRLPAGWQNGKRICLGP